MGITDSSLLLILGDSPVQATLGGTLGGKVCFSDPIPVLSEHSQALSWVTAIGVSKVASSPRVRQELPPLEVIHG